VILKNRDAYQYLSDSIVRFRRPEVFWKMMEDAGLVAVTYWPLTLGIVTVYAGKRFLA